MKPLSHVAFFRGTLLLPLILPVCASILAFAGFGENILLISIMPLIYGGIPYLVFLFLAWKWMRGKTQRKLFFFGLLAPVLFIPFQVMFMLLLWLLQSTAWFGRLSLRDCFEISYFVLLFGYGYVFLVLFVWSFLEYGTDGKFRLTE